MTEETKVCPYCAETIKAAAIVCRYCGSNLSNVNIRRNEVGKSDSSGRHNCPNCGHNDRTVKVSVVVESGTVSGTTREWMVDSDGDSYWATVPFTQISDLARKLALPERPEHYSPSCFWWIAPFLITPWLSGLIGPITKTIKVVMVVLLIVFCVDFIILLSLPGALDWPNTENPIISAHNCVSPFIAIGAMVLYYAGFLTETNRRATYINTVAIPTWEKANEVWNQLYYCGYDDYVFNPTTNEAVPADNKNEIIYK